MSVCDRDQAGECGAEVGGVAKSSKSDLLSSPSSGEKVAIMSVVMGCAIAATFVSSVTSEMIDWTVCSWYGGGGSNLAARMSLKFVRSDGA